jgi:Pyruvate/2-oxoacid:ferredoxin oxidoreductase delta subunit
MYCRLTEQIRTPSLEKGGVLLSSNFACCSCEKKCPEHAIAVPDGKNLAVIDRDKCTKCGTCVTACPKKCIVG